MLRTAFRRLFGLALLSLVAESSLALSLVVTTQSGALRGSGNEVTSFKGIPYAAPPTGDRRWRAPVPPAVWREVRDATQYGPRCPQPVGNVAAAGVRAGPLPVGPGQPGMSEDCLSLNIWSPARTATERLPVIVWVHGGGFQFGSGSVPETDGEALARRGVVLVSLNYRLGALGFLAHPQLSRESAHGVSGNYGLLDQVLALQWVHDNIAAFGGDPGNVTFMGQSAGGYSAAVMMVSPLARGLFHRIVAHSPPVIFGPRQKLRETYYGIESAEAKGARLVPDIAAFRAMPAEQVLERLRLDPTFSSGSGLRLGPIIDGHVEPEDASMLIGTTRAAAVPVMVGYAAEEGLFFRGDSPRTLQAYHDFLASRYAPQVVDAVKAAYPATDDASAAAAATRAFGESDVVNTAILMARQSGRRAPAYLFRFARVSPFIRNTWGSATHTADRLYWFDHITDEAGLYEARDRELAREMADRLVRFAESGNPNAPSLVRWPAYTSTESVALELGDTTRVVANPEARVVSLFERVWEVTRAAPLLRPRQ